MQRPTIDEIHAELGSIGLDLDSVQARVCALLIITAPESVALIPDPGAPADPAIDTDPAPQPPAADDDTIWHPLGFSARADARGFVRIKAVDAIRATMTKAQRDQLPDRFVYLEAYDNAVFPSTFASGSAALNMASRMRSPAQVPPEFNWNAQTYRVERKPEVPNIKPDYNLSPYMRNVETWHVQDLLVDPGNIAYSGNFDPKMDTAFFVELFKQHARERTGWKG